MEFALVVVPLFLILFGIVGFGMTLWSSQGLQAAAREGARVGSLPTATRTDVRQAVDGALKGVLWAPGPDGISISDSCAAGAEEIRVVVTAADSFGEIPLTGITLPRPEAEAVFRCE